MTDFDMTKSKNTSENQRQRWAEQKRAQRAKAAAKPLERFPSKFFEIMGYFEYGQESAEAISVAMDSEQQAQSLKFTWYEFKKAIKSPARGTSHAGWESLCERILLRVKGRVLTWSWRDLDKMYEALNQLELDFTPVGRNRASPLGAPAALAPGQPDRNDTEAVYAALADRPPTKLLTSEDMVREAVGGLQADEKGLPATHPADTSTNDLMKKMMEEYK